MEEKHQITVNVAREDFPSRSADVTVEYAPSYAQASWRPFLMDVMDKLDLQFVEGVYSRLDKAPVLQITTLVDGGRYLIRPRMDAALLEVLDTHIQPQEPVWDVIGEASRAVEELKVAEEIYPGMEERIAATIERHYRPLTCQEMVNSINSAQRPVHVADLVYTEVRTEKMPEEPKGRGKKKKARGRKAREKPKPIVTITYDLHPDLDVHRALLKRLLDFANNGTEEQQLEVLQGRRVFDAVIEATTTSVADIVVAKLAARLFLSLSSLITNARSRVLSTMELLLKEHSPGCKESAMKLYVVVHILQALLRFISENESNMEAALGKDSIHVVTSTLMSVINQPEPVKYCIWIMDMMMDGNRRVHTKRVVETDIPRALAMAASQYEVEAVIRARARELLQQLEERVIGDFYERAEYDNVTDEEEEQVNAFRALVGSGEAKSGLS